MLELLERLVNIDSGSYLAEGVDEVGLLLEERLTPLGLRMERTSLYRRGCLRVARRSFPGGRGSLLVLGHLDTVWPPGTAAAWPFHAEGERATGPGVGDMKGALVLCLYALDELIRRNAVTVGEIAWMLVPDEELGSPMSRPAIEEARRAADWVLVLEPARPGGGLVTARGAVGAFYLAATSVSAHSGVDYRNGASALRALARLVEPLEALSRPDVGSIFNVGIFKGGDARQVVPAAAEMHIDLRARTPDEVERLENCLRGLTAAPIDPRVRIALSGGWTRPAFAETDANRRLFAVARRVAGELDLTVHAVHSSGGSDASFSGALRPTLDGLGPMCHDSCSLREAIEIPSLASHGALFAGIVAGLG
jgi:glutamate carboxypeptidase